MVMLLKGNNICLHGFPRLQIESRVAFEPHDVHRIINKILAIIAARFFQNKRY